MLFSYYMYLFKFNWIGSDLCMKFYILYLVGLSIICSERFLIPIFKFAALFNIKCISMLYKIKCNLKCSCPRNIYQFSLLTLVLGIYFINCGFYKLSFLFNSSIYFLFLSIIEYVLFTWICGLIVILILVGISSLMKLYFLYISFIEHFLSLSVPIIRLINCPSKIHCSLKCCCLRNIYHVLLQLLVLFSYFINYLFYDFSILFSFLCYVPHISESITDHVLFTSICSLVVIIILLGISSMIKLYFLCISFIEIFYICYKRFYRNDLTAFTLKLSVMILSKMLLMCSSHYVFKCKTIVNNTNILIRYTVNTHFVSKQLVLNLEFLLNKLNEEFKSGRVLTVWMLCVCVARTAASVSVISCSDIHGQGHCAGDAAGVLSRS
jgi:hypothetical protein